jgi:hypothetical protein
MTRSERSERQVNRPVEREAHRRAAEPRLRVYGGFRLLGPVLLAVAAMGCFTYNEVPRTEALPGREIQVDLNEIGRTALVNQIGPQVRSVTGRLDASDTSGLTVAISKTSVMNGDDNGWHGEPMTIPYRYIAQIEERTLSKGKTVALVALAAGVLSGLTLVVGRASSPATTGAVGPGAAK